MATKPDLTWSDQGLFTLFLPETKEGERAWEAIAAQTEGTGKVLSMHRASTIAQLRAAGFHVRKAPPHKPLTADELAELEGLLA